MLVFQTDHILPPAQNIMFIISKEGHIIGGSSFMGFALLVAYLSLFDESPTTGQDPICWIIGAMFFIGIVSVIVGIRIKE